MTRAQIVALAFRVLGTTKLAPDHPIVERAISAAADADAAIRVVSPSMSAEEREAWTRRLLVWSGFESAWFADPPGSNDEGRACGVMQVHVGSLPPGLLPASYTCASVRKDRVAGYVVGLVVMRHLVKTCGGIESGLTAYATGGCHPSWHLPLVVRRLSMERDQ